jgi:chaperone required for assembly of F1-ATPase
MKTTKLHYIETKKGFQILNQESPLLTPLKKPIILPSEQIAKEFVAHDLKTNPLLKHVNTILDFVTIKRKEYEAAILEYIDYDSILYWSEEPKDLAQSQAKEWGKIITFVAKQANAIPLKTHKLETIEQNPVIKLHFQTWLKALNPFQLFGCHEIVFELKSVFITYALSQHEIDFERAFQAAFLEEYHQIGLWGMTEEQEECLKDIKSACIANLKLLQLS